MKRIVLLMCALALMACTLVACGEKEIDPIEMVAHLEAEGYHAYMLVDEEDIEDFVDGFDMRSRGIRYAIWVESDKYGDARGGIFIGCEDGNAAREQEADLLDLIEVVDDLQFTRVTIERQGLLVFVGCEDAWEAAQ